MNQVSVSSVNLNDTEARFTGTACRRGKSGNDVLNTIDRKRSRHRIVIGERQRTRRNDIAPPAFTFGNLPVACPWRVRAALAAGMRQLHPSHAALLVNKPHDASQRLNVIVFPAAQVLRTNPAFGKNGSSFGKHQSRAANRPAAQMHEVPVVRKSVRARVLAHRRNKYAVRKRNIPNRQRIKQVSHSMYAAFPNHSFDAVHLTPRPRFFSHPHTMHSCADRFKKLSFRGRSLPEEPAFSFRARAPHAVPTASLRARHVAAADRRGRLCLSPWEVAASAATFRRSTRCPHP